MDVKQTSVQTRQAHRSGAATTSGTILLLCPFHFGVRNFVHSQVISNLHSFGFQPYVVARASDLKSLRATADQHYGELLAPVLKQPRYRHILSVLDVLQRASFYRRYHLAYEQLTAWWYRRNNSRLRRMQHSAIDKLAIIGSRSPFYQWQMAALKQLQWQTWDLSTVRKQLQLQRPALVVATSCVSQLEEPFLLAARELGIRTLGFVQSFDNLISRSWVADCDFYAVWNQRMMDQLLRYHQIRNPAQIRITGTPQFDFHTQEHFRWSRAKTLERLRLAPTDHYILYAANADEATPTEPILVEELARRCAQTKELQTHRLVIRVHPNDNFSRWDQLEACHPRIVVSKPSNESRSFSSPEDQALLVNTLSQADVCHNMWSSMSLDAAIVDTPVVCVAFAGQPGSLEDRFCKQVYAAEFYQPIAESGGVRLAQNMDELLAETVAYVTDRSRDQAKRLQMVSRECGPLDGQSADRIAQLIASLATRT